MLFATHKSRFGERALLVVVLLTLGSSCSEELDPPATELEVSDNAIKGEATSKSVSGAQAATLTLTTGATLSIPRGAVETPTRIRLERPRDRAARELIGELEESGRYTIASAPYILTPHGTTFLGPVTLSLPIAPRARGADLAVLWLEDESDTNWKLLGSPVRRGDRATFQLDHFSVVILAATSEALPVDGGTRDAGAQLADTGLPDAAEPDAGDVDASTLGCESAGQPGVFVGRVVDSTTPSTDIAGVTVVVLDDVTGLPVSPSVQAVSASDGCIRLPVGSRSRFAVKALGNSNYTDTYTFNIGRESPVPLIRMGGNAFAVVIPAIAQYESLPDRAPVAGAVYWKTSDMPLYDVIGCARIESDRGDLVAQDLRYFAQSIPSSPTEWPLEQGTRPGDGRFFIGNAVTGAQRLTARLPDGTAIGSTQLVVFPRGVASTEIIGRAENLFFAPIYIDAPPGTTKPGCTP